jgi:hypothetical protein
MSNINRKDHKVDRKRKFNEIEEGSDEDILIDENLNSDNEEESKKSKQNKNVKILAGNNNFQALRQMRLMKKYNNKENTSNLLTQDQLEFAKRIVENKNNDNISKSSHVENNVTQNNYQLNNIGSKNLPLNNNTIQNNFQVNNIPSSYKNNSSYQNLKFSSEGNFSISSQKDNKNDKKFISEILSIMGLINSCEYKITQNDDLVLSLQVNIIKSEKEKINFFLNFQKTGNCTDYVEYLPIKNTINLEGEDTYFNEDLEIHKEDLGKLMKRLMKYKYI